MKIVNKNKAISESFANNLDKDILDIIKANDEQINYVKQGKCSKSSGYNILKAYNDPNTKEVKLVVGHLKPSNGKEELPTNTITHMWVEVDGNIYATNEPKGFDRVVDDSLVIDKSKDLYSQVENFLTKSTLKEKLIESNNYGYHAGDLGKSEYYGQQSSGRGTGHFGTGTYFVGDPNRIKGYNDYQYGKGEAPHHIVDFSSYNLYKPSTNKKGYALHDTLKILDGNYTYWKDKVDDVNVVRKYSTKSKRNYDQFTEDELEELINALNRLDSDEEPLNFEYFSTFLIPSNFDNYYEELTLADVDTDDAWDTQFELMEQLYDKVQEWSSSNVLYAVDKVRNIDSHLYQALEGKVPMSKIKQGLDAVEKASKQYKANRDKKVDSLATVFMKSLGYDGVDTRHLNKDDNEEGLAGLDNTAYGSVIYDVRPETIVESYEGKTFKLPQELVDKCIDYYKETYPTIKVDKLSIEQLVKDNDLLNDEDLQSYHQKQWDNKSAKEFSIAQDKINAMRVSEVPFVIKKKDKLELVDGRHRTRALYNDGYDYIELPVVEEGLEEHLGSNVKLDESSQEVDSEGNPLTQEQVEFFKDSKVRDNQGRLLVCYHGSKSSFSTFDKSKIKPWGWYGKGFYFTPSQDIASKYSKGHMITCYLNITNPFYADGSFTSKEEYYARCDKLYELVGITKGEIDEQDEECKFTSDPYYKLLMYLTNTNSSRDINDYVKELGYDGVIGLDPEGEEQELIVFEPNQIKSIDNKTPSNSDNINEEFEDGLGESQEIDEDVNRSFPEWQFGAKSFAKAFPPEDIEYMDNHQTVSSYPLYRCNTIEGSYKVGDTITFDRYRSFSKGAQGFNATLENVGVYFSPEECWCMQTRGKVSYFDATKVVNSILYQHQQEVLVKGTFKVVDITTFHSKDTEEDWPMYVVEQIDNGLDESLTEGKQDIENFKKWIEETPDSPARYMSGGNKEAYVNNFVNTFNEERKNLKAPYNDYYYWIKQNDWNAFTKMIADQGEKKASKQREKDGAKLIYSDNDWKVYEITTYEASKKYGANTKWCISGSKRWANGNSGMRFWDDYTKEGVKFYFFINKDTKYALALYPNGTDFEIFDAQDNAISYIPNAPIIDSIPVDYYTQNEDRLLLNLVKTGQLPHVCSILSSYLWNNFYDVDIYDKSGFDDFLNQIRENVNDEYVKWLAVYNGLKDEEWYKEETGEEYDEEWGGDTTYYLHNDLGFLDNYASLEDALTKDNPYFDYANCEYFISDLYDYDIDCCKDWVAVWLRIRNYIDEDALINFIKGDIRDYWNYEDFEKVGLSKEYLQDIDESLQENLREDKDVVEFLYHGSPSPTLNLERDSTLWLAEDYDYALGFGDYIHICSAYIPNILGVGNTDGYIRGLIPTQFSKEFTDLANKVGMQPKELLRACGEDCKNIYSLVRTKQFRKICMEKGYDAVETEEFGNICYGVFNRHNVELIDTEGTDEEPTPMDESKLGRDNGHQEVTDEPLSEA